MTYTFVVSSPVDRDLSNVSVTDALCSSAPVLRSKTGVGNDDAVLELGELWVYECSLKVGKDDPNPLPNTATAQGSDEAGVGVTDEDSHLVEIVPQPKIKIVKDGPDDANVGDVITYTLEVTTPIDRPLHNVTVKDPRCDDPPEAIAKGGNDDDVLDLGELWIYKCKHVATEGNVGLFKNTATVTARILAR